MYKLTAVSYTVRGVTQNCFMMLPVDADGKVRVPLSLESKIVRSMGCEAGMTYRRG